MRVFNEEYWLIKMNENLRIAGKTCYRLNGGWCSDHCMAFEIVEKLDENKYKIRLNCINRDIIGATKWETLL